MQAAPQPQSGREIVRRNGEVSSSWEGDPGLLGHLSRQCPWFLNGLCVFREHGVKSTATARPLGAQEHGIWGDELLQEPAFPRTLADCADPRPSAWP
jgi:hypothetical protein